MSIGLTAYIEFSQDAFASIARNRCATPGSVFFWHRLPLFEILGLPVTERVKELHPFGLRGIPACLSRPIVRRHHLVVSADSPADRAEKKRTRRYSLSDRAEWQRLGLRFFPLPLDPLYEIATRAGDELLLDPGCERPSWLTFAELRQVLAALGWKRWEHFPDEGDAYNQSVLEWLNSLADIYGEDSVRLVYWFDNLPERYLRLEQ